MYNTIISSVSVLGALNIPVDIRRKYDFKHRQRIVVFEEKGGVYIKSFSPGDKPQNYFGLKPRNGKITMIRKPYQIGIPIYLRKKYNLVTGTKVVFNDMGTKVKLTPMDDSYFDSIKKNIKSKKGYSRKDL
jgi:bifunctional DNA-binding transcriptional regulator/antitoxin component of YhaV-PrlF toxin-antitoxin module